MKYKKRCLRCGTFVGKPIHKCKKWTNKEIDFLKENFGEIPTKKISEKLNRGLFGIRHKARIYNITRTQDRRKWTKGELDFLHKNRKKFTEEELSKILKRNINTITKKLQILGIEKNKRWNKEKIIKELIKKQRELGRCPTRGDISEGFRSVCNYHFGSFSNALKKAGFNKNEWKEIKKEKARVLWKNEDWRKKQQTLMLKGLSKRPTRFEKKISELCIEHSLPFIYTGDGRFFIGNKNPDFVDKKNKIVIEVFYSWFKEQVYGSVENYKEFCRGKYNQQGWKIIFIDENEVDIKNWKELCLNKIQSIKNEN